MALPALLQAFVNQTGRTDCFVMCANSTGDIPHLVAALRAEPTLGVIIFDLRHHLAARVGDTLRSFGIANNRFLALPEAEFDPTHDQLARKKAVQTAWHQNGGIKTREIGGTSDIALDHLDDATFRKGVRKAFRGSKGVLATDQPLVDFWSAHPVPTGRDVVVLWGRGSGKGTAAKFGAHPYGDSSHTGILQLARACVEAGMTVLAAGDVKDDADYRARFPAQHFIFLGKFWRDPSLAGQTLTQYQQVRLFYLLHRHLKAAGKRLVHLGMRSGNLDYYAFSGQKVVYMFPRGMADARIQPFTVLEDSAWRKAELSKAPKAQFGAFDKNWVNLIKTTKLVDLLEVGSALTVAVEKFDEAYPNSTDEELLARVLYSMAKAKRGNKPHPLLADASVAEKVEPYWDKILTRFAAAVEGRGFSVSDLNLILARVNAAIIAAGPPPADEEDDLFG